MDPSTTSETTVAAAAAAAARLGGTSKEGKDKRQWKGLVSGKKNPFFVCCFGVMMAA